MRKEYDFSKSIKNPYAKQLKKQVTMRLGTDVIESDGRVRLKEHVHLDGPHPTIVTIISLLRQHS